MSTFLRIERFSVFLAAIAIYFWLGHPFWLFALLILAPDLSFIAYIAGPRVGAIVYNTLHTYLAPAFLVLATLMTGWQTGFAIALIWIAHIAGDRALGYGLKHVTGFKDTHLGKIGS